ncbi:hypothetical protein TCAL_15988 [Tigriopus californicus]|uniref:Uncharacterized protein n=1 Tax=Tigriopus californicus TaxID=6832 RepID=A0A553PFQ2_TIGCA|nr:hypothetical protein TCAL_15988 [Tigriopus californicus]
MHVTMAHEEEQDEGCKPLTHSLTHSTFTRSLTQMKNLNGQKRLKQMQVNPQGETNDSGKSHCR